MVQVTVIKAGQQPRSVDYRHYETQNKSTTQEERDKYIKEKQEEGYVYDEDKQILTKTEKREYIDRRGASHGSQVKIAKRETITLDEKGNPVSYTLEKQTGGGLRTFRQDDYQTGVRYETPWDVTGSERKYKEINIETGKTIRERNLNKEKRQQAKIQKAEEELQKYNESIKKAESYVNEFDPKTGRKYTTEEKAYIQRQIQRQMDEGKTKDFEYFSPIEEATIKYESKSQIDNKKLETAEKKILDVTNPQLGVGRIMTEEQYYKESTAPSKLSVEENKKLNFIKAQMPFINAYSNLLKTAESKGIVNAIQSDEAKQALKELPSFVSSGVGEITENVSTEIDKRVPESIKVKTAIISADVAKGVTTGVAVTGRAGPGFGLLAGIGSTAKELFTTDEEEEKRIREKYEPNKLMQEKAFEDLALTQKERAEATLSYIDVASGSITREDFTVKYDNLNKEIEVENKRLIAIKTKLENIDVNTLSQEEYQKYKEDVIKFNFDVKELKEKSKIAGRIYTASKYYDIMPFTSTPNIGVAESIAIGIGEADITVKERWSGKQIMKFGEGLEQTGLQFEKVGEKIDTRVPIVGDLTATFGRTTERAGTFLQEKPATTSSVITAGVVGTTGMIVSAPIVAGWTIMSIPSAVVSGSTAILAGQALRVSTRNISEDYIYGFGTELEKDIIRKGNDAEMARFTRAGSISSSFADRWVPFYGMDAFAPVGRGISNLTGYDITLKSSEKEAFYLEAERYYKEQGFEGEELQARIDLAMKRRTAKKVEAGARLIAIEVVSELSGGPLKGFLTGKRSISAISSRTAMVPTTKWQVFNYVTSRSPTYGAIGFAEGFSGSLIEQEKEYGKQDFSRAQRAGGWGIVTASSVGAVLDYLSVTGGLGGTREVPDWSKTKVKDYSIMYDETTGTGRVDMSFAVDADNVPTKTITENSILGIADSSGRKTAKTFTETTAYILDIEEGPGDVIAGVIEKTTGLRKGPSISTFETSFGSSEPKMKDVTGQVTVEDISLKPKAKVRTTAMANVSQNVMVKEQVTQQSVIPITNASLKTQQSSLFKSSSKTNLPVSVNVEETSLSEVMEPFEGTKNIIKSSSFNEITQFIPQEVPAEVPSQVQSEVPVQTTTNIFTAPGGFLPIFQSGEGWGSGFRGRRKSEAYQKSFTALTFGIKTKKQARSLFGKDILIEEKGKKKRPFSLMGLRI